MSCLKSILKLTSTFAWSFQGKTLGRELHQIVNVATQFGKAGCDIYLTSLSYRLYGILGLVKFEKLSIIFAQWHRELILAVQSGLFGQA